MVSSRKTFVQSVRGKENEAAEASSSHLVSIVTEAFLSLHDAGYVNSCVQERCLHARL